MKWTFVALPLLLAGCGGGSNTPAPPPVVFMGDSITAAWPLSSYLQDTDNAGVPGQTSVQMLARFQVDVLDRHPAAVVILAGTNDVLKIPSPNVDSIQRMADMAAHAGVKVIIGEIPPNSNWTTDSIIADPVVGNAAIESFNAALVMMAHASGYPVADYYDAMLMADGSQNVALFVDGTHPGRAGYDVMWPVLKKVL